MKDSGFTSIEEAYAAFRNVQSYVKRPITDEASGDDTYFIENICLSCGATNVANDHECGKEQQAA